MVYAPGGFTFLPNLLIMGFSYDLVQSLVTNRACQELIQYQSYNSVFISFILCTAELKKDLTGAVWIESSTIHKEFSFHLPL